MSDFLINPKNLESKLILYEHLKSLTGDTIVKVESTKRRSIDYNAYYFGILLDYIADETGEDTLIIHNFFAQKFLALTKNTRRSTASLNNREFRAYTTQCRVWAYEVLKIVIPVPEIVII